MSFQHPITACPTRRSAIGEHGMAMLTAILVMMLITGAMMAFASMVRSQMQQGRSEQQRVESLLWVEAASGEITRQLRSHQFGAHTRVAGTGTHDFWQLPAPGGRKQIAITTPGGDTQTGYYEVLRPVQGAPPNTAAFNRDLRYEGAERRGELSLIIRGSSSATDQRPRDVQIVLRRSSLARYSLVSDEPVDIGSFGAMSLAGSIHSNNVRGASVGVRIAPGVNTSAVPEISTTSGAIAGPCSAAECNVRTEKAVSFVNIDQAFKEVERLAQAGGPGCGTVQFACAIDTPMDWHANGMAPVYDVQLNAPGGGCSTGGIIVRRAQYPLRIDAGFASIINETATGTVLSGGTRTFCPSVGGMALLLNGDVAVSGMRPPGRAPVTILARNTSFPTVIPPIDMSRTTTRQQPASIHVLRSGGGVGSRDRIGSVGLIAEGSIYLPRSGGGGAATLMNVALVAKEGEIAPGPMMLAMAGSLAGGEGAGLNPCAPEGAIIERNATLTIVGSIATRRKPVLSYGTSACSFGFRTRRYAYAPNLEWNPPPLFPTTVPWHVAGWNEFAEARP